MGIEVAFHLITKTFIFTLISKNTFHCPHFAGQWARRCPHFAAIRLQCLESCAATGAAAATQWWGMRSSGLAEGRAHTPPFDLSKQNGSKPI